MPIPDSNTPSIEISTLVNVKGFHNHNEDNEFLNSEYDELLESEKEYLINYVNSFKDKIFFNRDEAFFKLLRAYLPSNIEGRPNIFLGNYVLAENKPFSIRHEDQEIRYQLEGKEEVIIKDKARFTEIIEERKKEYNTKD